MYTIGQIADKFDLSISTIRYYDKEGLLPNIKRKNGIRQFDDQDLEVFLVPICSIGIVKKKKRRNRFGYAVIVFMVIIYGYFSSIFPFSPYSTV